MFTADLKRAALLTVYMHHLLDLALQVQAEQGQFAIL